MGIVGIPGMVLLYIEYGPSYTLLLDPSIELCDGHFGKSVFGLHEVG
jgi:hypothetical protein